MHRQKQTGLTLPETILVLVIGSAMIVLGLRIYYSWAKQLDAFKLQSSVEQVLVAMRNYYQANCRATLSAPSGGSSTALSTGLLDPGVTVAGGIGTAGTLTLTLGSGDATTGKDLVKTGMLATNWSPYNPLVDNSVIPDAGFFAQFNRIQSGAPAADPVMNIYACTGAGMTPNASQGYGTTCNFNAPGFGFQSLDGTAPGLTSKVVVLTAQVSVKLASCTGALELQYQTGASCVTALPATTCSAGALTPVQLTGICTGNRYLVWERPANMLTENTTSPLWPSQPLVKQFNMQYTNDGMAALSGVNVNSAGWYDIRNYLCGG